MSARQSVAFNMAPEADEMYSQTPRTPPPQLFGQALAGETQIGSAVAGVGSGQLLYRQSESTRHVDPEGQGVQEGPPQSTSVSRPFCKECRERKHEDASKSNSKLVLLLAKYIIWGGVARVYTFEFQG